MLKRIGITCAIFLLVGGAVFGVSAMMSSEVGSPRSITTTSPCPATGCASGTCHTYVDVPSPDGINELRCPEASCSSVECHAWDTLATRYHQASDSSLNLWILAPIVLVIGLILLVKKM